MKLSSSASVLSLGSRRPDVDPSAFIAAGARVIGAVTIHREASVWYNAVLRADDDAISIGAGSNVQDNASLHVDRGQPVTIGENVSIGHNAVVHGSTVGDGSLIGMGSVVLSGAVIGAGCLIAGGALVLEGAVIPEGSLVAGVPARVRRALTSAERTAILENADLYRGLRVEHGEAAGPGR